MPLSRHLPPHKCFLTSSPPSPTAQTPTNNRLPQTTSQKNPLENVAHIVPSPCSAAHDPINNLHIPPEPLTPVSAAPQVPETYPRVSHFLHDRRDLSSRRVPPDPCNSLIIQTHKPIQRAILAKTRPQLSRATEMGPKCDTFQLKGTQPPPPNRHMNPALWCSPQHLHHDSYAENNSS